MLLVVLGAGASYDSAPSKHPDESTYSNLMGRPPLANQLFTDRPDFGNVMNKYPKVLDIAPRLRHLQGELSIETVLQGYQSETLEYPERFQQLASVRYYLQEIISSCTNQWVHACQNFLNHQPLLDDIKRWHRKGDKVCFVTFNYDKLLEYSLYRAGFPITSLSEYITQDFILIKLHGSVDWARYVDTGIHPRFEGDALVRELIMHSGELKISQRYMMGGDVAPHVKDNSVLFPALAIPIEDKIDFECPSDHVTALETFLPKVTKILIIGWRAAEKPFLNMLRKGCASSNPEIMIVNGRTDEGLRAADNIRRLGFSANYHVVNGGFTDFIRQNSGREFLRSQSTGGK